MRRLKAGLAGMAFLFWATLSCSSDGRPTGGDESGKSEDAEEFSLAVMKSIVELDTVAFRSTLGDTLWFLEEWERPILTVEFDVGATFRVLGHWGSGVTMEDFVATYEYTLYGGLAAAEMLLLPDGLVLTDEDILFVATVKPAREGFLHEDLLYFVVTRRSGGWRLLAL